MQAGLLRDFITIEVAEITRDEFGAQVRLWKPHWKGRARVQYSSGSTSVQNGETVTSVTRRITIRARVSVSTQMRITVGEQHYSILSIDDSSRDLSKVMICELINE